MAYEVTKLVNGRPYRYQVRSERDPASGKLRNRWTYLGRGDPGAKPGPAKPRPNARQALLDALERLLDRSDPGDVTAAAVSLEAGLAHGTFYRYFHNRVDAIRALADDLRET
ncbi:MAG TPA: TetR/AcrR family transcriptional regulator, partial [Candidatus Lustribacter sp.]|nr:TetR/AcrR family transcriptional regulator [Candidatus Lustribacter sp.]